MTFLERLLAGVLVAAAALMTLSAVAAAREAPLWDFQWSGAHLLAQGRDPYAVYLSGDMGAFVATQYPNYAPLLYVLLAPLGLLSLPAASMVWTAINVALAVLTGVMVGRAAGLRGARLTALTALTLCGLSYYDAVSKGQQTLLVLATVVVAARSRRSWIGGSGLAVALTKYSFAPLAFMWIARLRWRDLVLAAALHVYGALAVVGVTGSSLADVIAGPLRVARSMYPGSGSVFTLAELSGIEGNGTVLLAGLSAVGLGLAARRALASSDWVRALAAACLISLATFPHLLYDYCLLLPVAAIGLRLHGWERPVALAPVVVLWVPWIVGGVRPYAANWVIVVLVVTLAALVAVCRGGADDMTSSGRGKAHVGSSSNPKSDGHAPH